jgi:hypothetical protein
MLVVSCQQQVYLGKMKVIHMSAEKNTAHILTKDILNTKLLNTQRDKLLGINVGEILQVLIRWHKICSMIAYCHNNSKKCLTMHDHLNT